MDSAGFPARVTAHFVAVEGQPRPRTTILIKFAEEVSVVCNPLFLLRRVQLFTIHAVTEKRVHSGATTGSKVRLVPTLSRDVSQCVISSRHASRPTQDFYSKVRLVPTLLTDVSQCATSSRHASRPAQDFYILHVGPLVSTCKSCNHLTCCMTLSPDSWPMCSALPVNVGLLPSHWPRTNFPN